ncbi:SprT-like domain-containing protein [Tenacibaculum sp. nBUS_03]|uniref:SprT-like domain-containing protein n=1 Tax=Tenacibaculum sp. nBUS_03 TaxID=3395320 RepID=UPI003EBDB24F
MKKIFTFILIIGLIFAVQGQRRQFFNDKESFDEFRIKPVNFEDIIHGLQNINNNKNCSNCTEGLENFNFNFSDLNLMLSNERLSRIARDRKLRRWMEYQKNNRIKPEIEDALNKKFNNYNDAKNALFKATEDRSFNAYAFEPRNKYSKANRTTKDLKNKHLKELKSLKFREHEIKRGNINNSLYAEIRVNNIPLKNIKNVSYLENIRKGIIGRFEPNAAKAHINEYMVKELYSFDSADFTKMFNAATALKHQYHNGLDQWKQIAYMQALVYQLRYINSPMKIPNTLPIFDYRMLDGKYIEEYAKKNREGDISVFDEKYYHKLLYESGFFSGVPYPHLAEARAKARLEKLRKEKLNSLLNSSSIGASTTVDFFLETFNIRNQNIIQWLNDNYESKTFIDLAREARDYIEGAGLHPTFVYNKFLKETLVKGAIIARFLNDAGITNKEHKRFLYDNDKIRIDLQRFASQNIINRAISKEAKSFINEVIKVKIKNPNAIIDFEDRIINGLTGKALCAYEKLLSSGVSNFHNMITDLFVEFGTNNIGGRNLTFKMSKKLPNDTGGKTRVDSDGNYYILVNENLIKTLSSIEVASILVHEMSHAFLGKHYNDSNASFSKLYERYINNTGIQNYSHDIMKDQFINRMATAIKNYDKTIFSSFKDYKILASRGVFKLSSTQKQNLINVINKARQNDKNCL